MPNLTGIFISYAHKDARHLASRLQRDLGACGFEVWLDISRLAGGASWTCEIEQALDHAEVVLALLSTASFRSDICRAEQLRSQRRGKCVIPVLVHKDADRPLHLETRQYRDFSDLARYDETLKELIGDIVARSGATLPKKYGATFVTVPPLPANYIERSEELTALRDVVIGEQTPRHIGLTAVRGMAGIGKTILSQALCQDVIIQAAFPDGVIWVTIGQQPGDLVIQMREIGRALDESVTGFDTAEASASRLRTLLRDKAALLVLDNVWHADHVQAFFVNAPRCRLLFTTRDARVAMALGAHEHSLDVLTVAQALALLASRANQSIESLPPEAADVVKECGRLPLALAMVGGLVRGKPHRWQNLLYKLRHADLDKIQLQLPDYPYPNLLKAIQVSVDELPSVMRGRYFQLAVFPGNTTIPTAPLSKMWAVDLMEVEDTMELFVDLSLAKRDKNSNLILHDLQLDYARAQMADQAPSLHQRLLDAYGPEHDSYMDRRMAFHLAGAQRHDELRKMLLDFDRMQAKIASTDANSLVADYEYLRDDSDLRLVQSAIRLSAHVLAKDKAPLASQLLGRLQGFNVPTLQPLLNRAREWRGAAWLRPLKADLTQAGGAELRTIAGHSNWVTTIAVTSDGQLAVSGSGDQTLKVWELENGAELKTLSGHTDWVRSLSLIRNWQLISASNDGTLKVWDLNTSAELRTLAGHTDWVNAVAVAADGRRAISACEDGTLKVWDLENGTELLSLCNHDMGVTGVAVTADGRMAISSSEDRTLKVWDLKNGTLVRTLTGHRQGVSAVALTPDGRRAISASDDQTLKIWDLESGTEIRSLEGHTACVNAVAVTTDGRRVLSASDDQTLMIWDVETGAKIRTLSGHGGWLTSVAVTTDGRRAISASTDRTLKVWDLENDAELRIIHSHVGRIHSIVAAGGERAVSASSDQLIKVWDLKTGDEIVTVVGQAISVNSVNAVAVAADGRRAISACEDGTLKVWELESGAEVSVLVGHSLQVNAVAVTADGKQAISAAADQLLKVWNLENGTELHSFIIHTDALIRAIAVTADGRRAVLAFQDPTLKVWDLESGAEIRSLAGHTGSVNAVTLTTDGRRAISASDDQTLKVWDLESGVELHTLVAHTSWVNAVAVTADGRRAISASDDHTLVIWDLKTGAEKAKFFGDGSFLSCAASPGTDTFIAGDSLGRVHFLRLEEAAPIAA